MTTECYFDNQCYSRLGGLRFVKFKFLYAIIDQGSESGDVAINNDKLKFNYTTFKIQLIFSSV